MSQVVSIILAYLSRTDLLSCTRVSSVWEGEARKHLLKMGPTTSLCCQQVCQYLEDMTKYHAYLFLTLCRKTDCLDTLLTQLTEANCLANVIHLSTDWDLRAEWGPQFQKLGLFFNLTNLVLRPECEPWEFNIEQLENRRMVTAQFKYLTQNQSSFPSVQTLTWHEISGRRQDTVFFDQGIILQMLAFFPNLNTFNMWNVKGPLLATLSAVCSTNNLLINITELEFNICQGQERGWNTLLAKCAPILEHLSIRGVKNKLQFEDPDAYLSRSVVLTVPVLPRLKTLQILRTRPSSATLIPDLPICHCHPARMFSELWDSVPFPTRIGSGSGSWLRI